MKVIATEKLPIKIWLGVKEDGEVDMENGALAQARNLANLPFAFKHVAIMPDTHEGYGMPIGGVLATKGVVIPNAVGVDIGCGMCAVKLGLHVDALSPELLKKIIGRIREIIPVGFSHRSKPIEGIEYLMPALPSLISINEDQSVTHGQYSAALKQAGTLGGGNHFIEIQADEEDNVWIMVHSGSRNVGKQVADHWNKKAIKLNERWYAEVPEKWQLAFLPMDSDEAKDYFTEMQYCVDFALANRRAMMDMILLSLEGYLGNLSSSDIINIAHNYASWENHYGHNVVVHRKGATRARKNEIGIIPGSMGTNSYIVKGLGNAESFTSCSHGAGRRMGRKEATRKLDLSTEIGNMDAKGIVHGLRNQSDLDEAPGAYKEIDIVMENQKDLVTPIVKLRPLAVVKG
jgi:tRNA-splicing ligase RtcB